MWCKNRALPHGMTRRRTCQLVVALLLGSSVLTALEPIRPDVGPLLLQARREWERGTQKGLEAGRVARANGDPIPLLDEQIAAFDTAEKHYLSALKLVPDHPYALFDYGRLLISQRRYRDAQNRLDQALKSPETEKAFLPAEMADLMRMLGGVLERAGQWPRAIELYRKALQVNPDDPRNRISLAVALCAWDDPTEAVGLLLPWKEPQKGLVALTPALRALGLYTLGYALEEDGRPEDAAAAYGRARELAKEAGSADTVGVAEQAEAAQQRLGPLLEDLKREGAKEALARAANLCREGWRRRVSTLQNQEVFLNALRQLWDARGNDEKALIRMREPLASLYGAIRCFDSAAQACPRYARPYRELGLCYLALVEVRAALPQLEVAAVYDPHSPGGQAALGEAQLSAGQVEEALNTFSGLLKTEPEYGPANLGLARAALRLLRSESDLDLAQQSLERASALGAEKSTIDITQKALANLRERLRKGEKLVSRKPKSKAPRTTAPEGDDLWKGSVLDR
jgi:tetratricopeptide (TPR) repeat protein